MKEKIQEGLYQINAYELDAHEVLKEGDLFIVQSAGETSVLHKVTLDEIKAYMGSSSSVPDTTITDIKPTTMTSGTAFSYDASANRTYKQLILSGSLAAAITFTISADSGKTNEHYLLVTNNNSSAASVAVTVGSWDNLIGMSEAVEIAAGKSVEFSFKVYNSGSSTYLVVTHSEEL